MKVNRFFFCLILLAPILWIGCIPQQEDSEYAVTEDVRTDYRFQPPDPQEDPAAYAYDCEDGSDLVARPSEGSSVVVFHQERSYALPYLKSAPGFRYGNEEATFVNLEDRVEFILEGKSIECREDPRKSLMETARLRGADFYAFGEDPDWTLDVGEMATHLNLQAEEVRYRFPTPPPESGAEPTVTVYQTEAEGVPIRIEKEGSPCRIEMGEPTFPFTTRIEIEGRTLEGCGEPVVE